MLLVDGGMLSPKVLNKSKTDVECEVVDGGCMGSRYDCFFTIVWLKSVLSMVSVS